MADETCEVNRCIKRYYKYTFGKGAIFVRKTTFTGGDLLVDTTPQEVLRLEKVAIDALKKRMVDGKMLKDCPKGFPPCKCKAPKEMPANLQWLPDKPEPIKYRIRVPKFMRDSGEEEDVTIQFTAQEQHADLTAECGIEEEDLGFLFSPDQQKSVVLTTAEIASLATERVGPVVLAPISSKTASNAVPAQPDSGKPESHR